MTRALGSALLACAGLAAFSNKAQAQDGYKCAGTVSIPVGYNVCVSSVAGADFDPSVVSLGLGPDRFDSGSASTGEVATSNYGAASAKVSAAAGKLSGETSARRLAPLPPEYDGSDWGAGSTASAAFQDTVLIQGQPGVALGTQVVVHLRSVVQGTFSAPSATNVLGAEARFEGFVYLNGQTKLDVPLTGAFSAAGGDLGGTLDTVLPLVHTGDSLLIKWGVLISSNVDWAGTLEQTGAAVIAQIFIDLDPTVATAVGQTAYTYSASQEEAGGSGGAEAAEGGMGGVNGEVAGDAGSEAGTSAGGVNDAAPDAAGSAGRNQEEASGAGGAASSSSHSSGCSISNPNVRPRSFNSSLLFAFVLGGFLLARSRRRQAARRRVFVC